MSPQTAPVSLADIQHPLRVRLEKVQQELRRVVEADFGLITEVNAHLFRMQGKLFRPTLLLLVNEATGAFDRRAPQLAAVVELIHLVAEGVQISLDSRRGLLPVLFCERKRPTGGVGLRQQLHTLSMQFCSKAKSRLVL